MKVLCIVQPETVCNGNMELLTRSISGKPVIVHTLQRLMKARLIDEVIVAASNNIKDSSLVSALQETEFHVFTGNKENMLKRFKEASGRHFGDIIVRIKGNCPFISPDIVDNVISYFKMYDYDYVHLDVPNSFPEGLEVEVFSKEALDKCLRKVIKSSGINTISIREAMYSNECSPCKYYEGVTNYILKHPREFKIGTVKGEETYNRTYKLSVDTKEDFKLISNIYRHFDTDFPNAKEVIKFLDENPEIAEINQKQKSQP